VEFSFRYDPEDVSLSFAYECLCRFYGCTVLFWQVLQFLYWAGFGELSVCGRNINLCIFVSFFHKGHSRIFYYFRVILFFGSDTEFNKDRFPLLFSCKYSGFIPASGYKNLEALFPEGHDFSVYYINIFLDTIFSSLYWIVGTGGIACLYYASRVVLLPVNLIGGSFSTVSVPLLSRYRHLKDERSFEEAFMYSLKNTSFFIIPCSVILCLYAYPIIKLLFQRGQFTPYSTFLTSWTLIFYGLGLYFFASNNILGTFFFSHNDLLTPFKVSLGALVLNAILDLCLIFSLKLGGVALATTISAVVRYAVFIRIIEAKGLSFKDYFSYFKKPLVFSLFSGVISLGVFYFLRVSEIPKIFSTFLIYGASYFIFSSKFRFIPFWK